MATKFVLFFIFVVAIKYCYGEVIYADGGGESCLLNEDCIVNCDSDCTSGCTGYCEDETITCNPNSYGCTINCYGRDSCKNAKIICPSDATCVVNCSNLEACEDASITWPDTSSLGQLYCDSFWESCKNINFPIPDPNTPLTITCTGDSVCEEAVLYCPTNADCTVECNQNDACYGAVILWPTATNTNGYLKCNGTESCRLTNFPFPTNQYLPLTVTCDSTGECKDSFIACPQHADCTIICDSDNACDGAVILWSTDLTVLSTLTCNGIDACLDTTLPPLNAVAPNTEDYYLICDTSNECENYDVYCPQDYSCFIQCNAPYACKNMEIYWVTNQAHNITCGSFNSSCYAVNPISYSNDMDINLNCSEANMCQDIIIDCPLNAECNIKCSGIDSCNGATINWIHTQKHSILCSPVEGSCRNIGNIQQSNQLIINENEFIYDCSGLNSCSNSVIYCPNVDCIVYCNGTGGYSCETVTIHGSVDNELTVICDNSHACDYGTIYAQDVSYFLMTPCSDGSFTCTRMTLYFPPNDNGTKLAVIDGANNNFGLALKFYAIYGWLDVDIINYHGNNYANSLSTFYCGIYYIWSCTMSTSQWGGGCGVCDAPIITDMPTAMPTKIPTSGSPTTRFPTTATPTTTTPTASPTKIPTYPLTTVSDPEESADVSESDNTDLIIGLVVGISLLLCLAMIIFIIIKKKKTSFKNKNVIELPRTDGTNLPTNMTDQTNDHLLR